MMPHIKALGCIIGMGVVVAVLSSIVDDFMGKQPCDCCGKPMNTHKDWDNAD